MADHAGIVAYKSSLINLKLFQLQAQEMGVYELPDGTSWCTTIDPQRARRTFTISLFLVFILPMLLISVLYILIGLQLRKSKIVNRGGPAGSSVRLKVIKSVTLVHLIKPASRRTVRYCACTTSLEWLVAWAVHKKCQLGRLNNYYKFFDLIIAASGVPGPIPADHSAGGSAKRPDGAVHRDAQRWVALQCGRNAAAKSDCGQWQRGWWWHWQRKCCNHNWE